MKESGILNQEREMDEEYKCGQMGPGMRGIGNLIKLMEEGD